MAGGIENLFNQWFAVFILVAKNIAGDLDKVGVEVAFVPFSEDLMHFVGCHAEALLHQVVGLADQLHVAVFDAVVHHLDIVAGTVIANPVAAGRAVLDLGGDRLENVLHMRPSIRVTTGHDRRASACAFFAPGNSGADEKQAARLQVLGASDRVLVERVAAIDDNVAGLEVGDDLVDEIVHRLAGLHQHHDAAWAFQMADHFLNRPGTDDVRALGFAIHEVVHLGDGSVVGNDREAVVVHVQDQVLAHHGQSDQCNIAFGFHSVFCLCEILSHRVAVAHRRQAGRGCPSDLRSMH